MHKENVMQDIDIGKGDKVSPLSSDSKQEKSNGGLQNPILSDVIPKSNNIEESKSDPDPDCSNSLDNLSQESKSLQTPLNSDSQVNSGQIKNMEEEDELVEDLKSQVLDLNESNSQATNMKKVARKKTKEPKRKLKKKESNNSKEPKSRTELWSWEKLLSQKEEFNCHSIDSLPFASDVNVCRL